MTRKPSPKVFVSEELAQRLRKLGLEHKITKWISDMKTVLKENMYARGINQEKPNSETIP